MKDVDLRDVGGEKIAGGYISLFENATGAAADFGTLRARTMRFSGHDAEYVEDGPTTLLTWRERGLYFALVSDLMRPELAEIAKSVVP